MNGTKKTINDNGILKLELSGTFTHKDLLAFLEEIDKAQKDANEEIVGNAAEFFMKRNIAQKKLLVEAWNYNSGEGEEEMSRKISGIFLWGFLSVCSVLVGCAGDPYVSSNPRSMGNMSVEQVRKEVSKNL